MFEFEYGRTVRRQNSITIFGAASARYTLSLAPSCSSKVIVGWIGGRARLDGKCVCYAYELRSSHTYLQVIGIYECL